MTSMLFICPVCNKNFAQRNPKRPRKTCSTTCRAKLSNLKRTRPIPKCAICSKNCNRGSNTCGSKKCLYLYKQQIYDKRNPNRTAISNCTICGAEYVIGRNKKKTCSKICANKLSGLLSHKPKPVKYCPVCGGVMPKKHGKTCSKACGKVQYTITSNENWGSDYPNQSSKFLESALVKTKDYVMPSGKEYKVQGNEPQALDILLCEYKENDIVIDDTRPIIRYFWSEKEHGDNKWHSYFPDIFIPNKNLIIEVKSTWTYDGCGKNPSWYGQNQCKKKAAIRAGYTFQFFIFDGEDKLKVVI